MGEVEALHVADCYGAQFVVGPGAVDVAGAGKEFSAYGLEVGGAVGGAVGVRTCSDVQRRKDFGGVGFVDPLEGGGCLAVHHSGADVLDDGAAHRADVAKFANAGAFGVVGGGRFGRGFLGGGIGAANAAIGACCALHA